MIKYAKHRGDDPAEIAVMEKELEAWRKSFQTHYHVSGFSHPDLLVFTNEKPKQSQAYRWGLIPSWVKDNKTAHTLSNQTINARAETIYEKPSFRNAAQRNHCLIYLDAFYEHHHAHGKTYPFHIAMKNGSPLSVAGLWDEWVDKETGEVIHSVTIITTTANATMSKIHNNPKLAEPRMPVILPKDKQDEWLTCNDKKQAEQLLIPFPDKLLEYHTVRRLKGKEAVGDCPEAEEAYVYEELETGFG